MTFYDISQISFSRAAFYEFNTKPWKHFVKRFDSLFLSVKNNLRGRSGCFIRMCWMYTCELNKLILDEKNGIQKKTNKFVNFIITCADLYANLISTSLHRDPSHRKTCSPLSSNMISSSAKSS